MKTILTAIYFLLFVFAGCKTNRSRLISSESQKAVQEIKKGMTLVEVDNILIPHAIEKSYLIGGGFHDSTWYYHLKDGNEVTIHIGGFLNNYKVDSIGKITPKTKWFGHYWNPDEKQKKLAINILKKELDSRFQTIANIKLDGYRNDAAMMTTSNPILLVIKLKEGKEIKLEAHISSRIYTHKLIEGNLIKDSKLVTHFAIDIDDKVIVPTHWEPSESDIAEARKITDIKVDEFLQEGKNKKIIIKTYGTYDYGPLRKLLNISYSEKINVGLREGRGNFTVDMTTMKLRND